MGYISMAGNLVGIMSAGEQAKITTQQATDNMKFMQEQFAYNKDQLEQAFVDRWYNENLQYISVKNIR